MASRTVDAEQGVTTTALRSCHRASDMSTVLLTAVRRAQYRVYSGSVWKVLYLGRLAAEVENCLTE